MKRDTHELFKVPMWHLSDNKLPKGIYEWCYNYPKTHPSVETAKSNRGGYQSIVSYNFKEFKYTKYLLSDLEFLPPFHLTGWWINVNKKGNYNISHTHANTDLAVVWYITDGSLIIEDPNEHNKHFIDWVQPIYKEHLTYSMGCKAGDILIFPAYIRHWVEPHTENSPRISIAFNLNRAN